MFNTRQLLGLELSCQAITLVSDAQIRNALATNLSDLLRYQNMLCRYDSMALKSLDIFSVHGLPVGLIQCESNLLEIPGAPTTQRDLFVASDATDRSSIRSGGWANIIQKYTQAQT